VKKRLFRRWIENLEADLRPRSITMRDATSFRFGRIFGLTRPIGTIDPKVPGHPYFPFLT
jgi:hypothetical protein